MSWVRRRDGRMGGRGACGTRFGARTWASDVSFRDLSQSISTSEKKPRRGSLIVRYLVNGMHYEESGKENNDELECKAQELNELSSPKPLGPSM